MKKNLFFSFAVLCIVCLNLLVTGCDKKEDTIKIGVILPLTGNLSALGNSVLAGLEIAVTEINEDSPVKFELIIEDIQSEQKYVLNAYKKIKTQHKIQYVVTTGTAYSMALKPEALKDNILLFCIASFPDLTVDAKHNVFRIGNTSVDEANALVDYIKNEDTYTSLGTWLFYPNTEYGIPFYETIQRELGPILRNSTIYNEQDQDYKNLVLPAMQSDVENIIAIGFSPALGRLIKSIREINNTKDISSNLGFYNHDVLLSAGDAKYGVKYVDYQIDGSIGTDRRREIANEKYNTSFSSTCFLAYSIPYLLQKGISTENNEEAEEIKEISDRIKASGEIKVNDEYLFTINPSGEVLPSLSIYEYND